MARQVPGARVARAGRDRLGEGPTWDARHGELVWVDILAAWSIAGIHSTTARSGFAAAAK